MLHQVLFLSIEPSLYVWIAYRCCCCRSYWTNLWFMSDNDSNIPSSFHNRMIQILPGILFSLLCILCWFIRIAQWIISTWAVLVQVEKNESNTNTKIDTNIQRFTSSKTSTLNAHGNGQRFTSSKTSILNAHGNGSSGRTRIGKDTIGICIGSTLMPMLLFCIHSSLATTNYYSIIHALAIIVSWLGLSFILGVIHGWFQTPYDATFHSDLFAKRQAYLHVALFTIMGIGLFVGRRVQKLSTLSFKDTCFLSIYMTSQIILLLTYDRSFIPTILSRGEWIFLSILLSILISDFSCYISFSWRNEFLYTQDLAYCHDRDVWVDYHLRLGQAGLIGCLSGCLCIQWKPVGHVLFDLAYFMEQSLICLKTRISRYFLIFQPWNTSRYHNNTTYHRQSSSSDDGFIAPWLCVLLKSMLVGIHILITVFLSLQSISCGSYKYNPFDVLLQPMDWLMNFLLSREGNFTFLSYRKDMSLPRYFWLIYWTSILLIAIPTAIHLAQYISTQSTLIHQKRKLVVISRKYFHFIAVLLFGPPTYFAPQMMSFSYAVALCLLLVIECIRCGIDINKPSALHHPSLNINGSGTPSSSLTALNDFFHAFLGDHDTKNGFVITHILLIFGCAFPLWCYLLLSPLFQCEPILPFIGIITLGIGDSFGAIFGVMLGNNFWPGSKRTVEGSMSMFLSMHTSIVIVQTMLTGRHVSIDTFIKISLPITLLEACTSQIDNLYLPVMATVLIMLETNSLA